MYGRYDRICLKSLHAILKDKGFDTHDGQIVSLFNTTDFCMLLIWIKNEINKVLMQKLGSLNSHFINLSELSPSY